MALQSSFYSGTALDSRTFPSTKHIATKQHMSVWIQQTIDDVWVQVDITDYQLINNTCVLNQLISQLLYKQLEVRVADDPNELVSAPSEISIVAGIANDVVTVVGIANEVVTVDSISNEVVTVSGIEANIVDVTTNPLRQDILDAEENARNAALSAASIGHAITSTIDTLRAMTDTPTTIYVTGYHTANDNAFGSHIYKWDDTSTEADNNGTIIKLSSETIGRYKLQYNGTVDIRWFGLVPIEKTTDLPNLNVTDGDLFIDTLRQVNFHTSGAADGQHTFLIPDNKFRIQEASRSLPKLIGSCEKILFVGDSLTAINDGNSYTNQIARRMVDLKGGLKEIGYMAYESTVISAKQNNFGIQLTHSQFTDFATSAQAYSSDERKFSPDGKGFTITGADGTPYIKLTMNNRDLVKYDTFKLYYLIQPTGGTFDIRARGDANATSVDTAGTLGLGAIEVTPTLNGALEQYDLWIENVIGDVTVYGVDFKDSQSQGKFSYDTFAISGGALWELVQLDYSALNSYLNYRQPDTVVINIGTNDSSQLRTPTEFITDLTTYVQRIENALSALYEVNIVIVTPNNMQWTNFPTINYHTEYEDARRKFARDFNYMYIDTPSEIGNFNHAWQNGWMKDGTHPNAKGLDIIGAMIGDKLISNMKSPILQTQYSTPKISIARWDVSSGVITNLVVTNKILGVTYTSTGTYNITHSIGSDNFIAVATAGNANRFVAINGQSSASLNIDYRGGDGSLQDGRVHLLVHEF